ncbi:hypothetical protein B0A50_00234 [Salinomyces thailandicus]|uniref:Uncharacterized protein n=1 Tax=Salinomyces thailandicus TaxID=706561 RepID=A0A4U0UFL8_9PEZI|nr:hypothetical protein B0A50_00234 [Salinomyces thailandica]
MAGRGTRRSARLASQEPEIDVSEYDHSPLRTARRDAVFDVDAAIDARLPWNSDWYIYKLTPAQREAVLNGLTRRNDLLSTRIEDLEQEVTTANNGRDVAVAEAGRKRSLQQAAARERIDRQARQRREARESAAATTPSRLPSPPKAEQQQQQPEQQQNQQQHESRAQTTSEPMTTQPPKSPEAEQAPTTAPTTATTTPPANTQAVPTWRKLIQSASGYLTPFRRRAAPNQNPTPIPQLEESERKRAAPEGSIEQTAKRPRTAEQPRRTQLYGSETRAAEDTPAQQRITAHVPQTAPAARKQTSKQSREAKKVVRRRRTPSQEPADQGVATAQAQAFTPSRESTPAAEKRSPTSDDSISTDLIPHTTIAETQASSSQLGELTPASRKRAFPSEDADTPRPAGRGNSTPKAKTPSMFLGPSSKNPKVPTSLSTIAEQSEISRIRDTLLSESTPLPPMTTPSRMPHKRRTVAEARRARLSGGNGFSTPRFGTPRFTTKQQSEQQLEVWERSASTAPRLSTAPRPADSNADRRFEKMMRMRKLQRELEQLKEDDDIKEMESHRRKRVKVDDLEFIPHCRPGEGSGTFRVPDIDSDDEMEVDFDVPLKSNLFQEAIGEEQKGPNPVKQIQETPKAKQTQETRAVQQVRPSQPVQPVQPVQTDNQQGLVNPTEAPVVSEWNFPDVGKRAEGDVPSPEEELAYRDTFRAGFAKFCVERGYWDALREHCPGVKL